MNEIQTYELSQMASKEATDIYIAYNNCNFPSEYQIT